MKDEHTQSLLFFLTKYFIKPRTKSKIFDMTLEALCLRGDKQAWDFCLCHLLFGRPWTICSSFYKWLLQAYYGPSTLYMRFYWIVCLPKLWCPVFESELLRCLVHKYNWCCFRLAAISLCLWAAPSLLHGNNRAAFGDRVKALEDTRTTHEMGKVSTNVDGLRLEWILKQWTVSCMSTGKWWC